MPALVSTLDDLTQGVQRNSFNKTLAKRSLISAL
jgi:hypothetical protein